MHLNLKTKQVNTYDAIVIGSGISGGWAAKELCEKGLKTLVLDRGRNVRHVEDYPTAMWNPWDMKYRGALPPEIKNRYITGFPREDTLHWFVPDDEHPYIQEKPFRWVRGYHVGGKSIMWGRHCYRLTDLDFEANAKDGFGVDWPIRYKDIEGWYDYVERFAGIQGMKEGLAQLPDGQLLPPMELNCLEQHLRQRIAEHFPGRVLTTGRTANLTQPIHGRGSCQYRNLCDRGCPYGGYFSSNAATLPAAEKTGNMTLRPYAVVAEILYDKEKKRASGVRIVDTQTKQTEEYFAKVIFCCASTVATTQILLNSISDAFPDGLGNSSGELGHNLMDHHHDVGAYGKYDGFQDYYYTGRRPNGIYLARYRNLDKQSQSKNYVRGYGYQGGGGRDGWSQNVRELGVGAKFKEKLAQPGEWTLGIVAFGECLPYHENRMYLDREQLDSWGLPLVVTDAEFKENEAKMREEMLTDAAEMLEAAGFKDIITYNNDVELGSAIHEMGTARMGRDPKTSVLNSWNQMWDVPNVFVTDGACMTSSACQNPSLTYMALTARAADHAVGELRRMNL